MANLGYVSSFNINGNELSLKDAALTEIVEEIIEAIGANNGDISERINNLHDRSFDALIKISSNDDSEIASIQDGLYKVQYVTVTGEGEQQTETLNNSAILIQQGTHQYLYKDGELSNREKTNDTWGDWITFEGGVTSVNGQTGAVNITIPTKTSDITNDSGFITDAGVTSFNGQTGAVTYTAPVTSVDGKTGAVTIEYPITSVNGQTGAVTIDTGVTSFNGQTGAVTYTAPVTSVDGKTGTVTIEHPVTSVNGQTGAVTIDTGVTSFNGSTGAVTYTAPVTSVNGQTGAVTIDLTGKADKSAAIGSLQLSINSTDYKVTLSGTKVDGTAFTCEDIIDLPLETMVVSGAYDDTTQKIVLTLKNGTTTDFPVSALIDGLQSEITSTNKLSADLISDGNTNKVVTQAEKDTWNNKVTSVNGQTGVVTIDAGVTSFNGQTGAVTYTAPVTSVNGQIGVVTIDTGVTSFNGQTGAVTYTAPVTSVNGQTGVVTIDTGVTSFNGQTGAVTYTAPVTSVNGQTGAVTIDTGVTSFNGQTGAVTYTAPVTSVNGQTGAVNLSIPDAITESTVAGWGFTKNTGTLTGVKMNGTTNNPTNGVVDLGTVLTSFTETDPTVPAHVKSITQANITSWNSKTDNVGTITGIKMNGSTVGTAGIVDLGTVITSHQDISNKVDKIDGKGLSTNDYTTTEKEKLASIEIGDLSDLTTTELNSIFSGT